MTLKAMKALPPGTIVRFQGEFVEKNGKIGRDQDQLVVRYEGGEVGIIRLEAQAECFHVVPVASVQ